MAWRFSPSIALQASLLFCHSGATSCLAAWIQVKATDAKEPRTFLRVHHNTGRCGVFSRTISRSVTAVWVLIPALQEIFFSVLLWTRCHDLSFFFLILSFKLALSPSSRSSLFPLHCLPLKWHHLHVWGCWSSLCLYIVLKYTILYISHHKL